MAGRFDFVVLWSEEGFDDVHTFSLDLRLHALQLVVMPQTPIFVIIGLIIVSFIIVVPTLGKLLAWPKASEDFGTVDLDALIPAVAGECETEGGGVVKVFEEVSFDDQGKAHDSGTRRLNESCHDCRGGVYLGDCHL